MKSFLTLALLISSQAFAQTGDLTLPGEKWVASFNGYVCDASGNKVTAPKAFSDINVKFERMTTDSTLDNGLIKATFEEEGKACRYSAIIFADNALKTSRLVQSKAYAVADDSDCQAGKDVIDAAFEHNDYLYYGHPHNLAFMAPVAGASDVCEGASLVGVNFVVSGRITTK